MADHILEWLERQMEKPPTDAQVAWESENEARMRGRLIALREGGELTIAIFADRLRVNRRLAELQDGTEGAAA